MKATSAKQTAISARLEVAGMRRCDYEFATAVMNFFKSGGDAERAHELVDATAKRMSGTGHRKLASDGQKHCSRTVQPVEGGIGRPAIALKGPAPGASSPSSDLGREGHDMIAPSHYGDALPAREPTKSQRMTAASVRKVVSLTVLDTFKVRDGRSIGDIRFGELENLRATNAMEASLLRQIQRKAVAAPDARVRDVIKVDELQRMIQRASEVADAQ